MAYIHRITASWPWPAGEASPLAPIRTENKKKTKKREKKKIDIVWLEGGRQVGRGHDFS
jgi:hypothetical protein